VIIDRSGMESVENGGGRPARYTLARRRVVIFSVGYYISLSYEEKARSGGFLASGVYG